MLQLIFQYTQADIYFSCNCNKCTILWLMIGMFRDEGPRGLNPAFEDLLKTWFMENLAWLILGFRDLDLNFEIRTWIWFDLKRNRTFLDLLEFEKDLDLLDISGLGLRGFLLFHQLWISFALIFNLIWLSLIYSILFDLLI